MCAALVACLVALATPVATAALPLVVDMHGLFSNGAQQAVFSGWRQLSDAEGFLVVHPDGIANRWNAGTCCGNPNLDDVGFLRRGK